MLGMRDFQARMRDFSLGLGERGSLLPFLAQDVSPDRLSIHRNNTRVGLTAALRDAFPVVERLVGADYFEALADAFITARPPGSPILLAFGTGFPAFLDRHPVQATLPYLADVARLELAWQHAYHAVEATGLAPDSLVGLDEARLAGLRLKPHPSLRFLASAHPISAIWLAHQAEEIGPVEFGQGDQILVFRPEAQVVVMPVSPGAFSFVMALALDQPLAAAWEGALAIDPDFSLDREMAVLLAARLFVEFAFS